MQLHGSFQSEKKVTSALQLPKKAASFLHTKAMVSVMMKITTQGATGTRAIVAGILEKQTSVNIAKSVNVWTVNTNPAQVKEDHVVTKHTRGMVTAMTAIITVHVIGMEVIAAVPLVNPNNSNFAKCVNA